MRVKWEQDRSMHRRPLRVCQLRSMARLMRFNPGAQGIPPGHVLDALPDAVLLIDADQHIAFANAEAARLLGHVAVTRSEERSVGKECFRKCSFRWWAEQ